MAQPPTILARWETAKTDFERVTGRKKPKADTKLGKMFNFSGLTGAMKDADAAVEKAETERNLAKRPKLRDDCRKKHAALKKAADAYLKDLDKAIKNEFDGTKDKKEQTDYYKGLKFLDKELKSLVAWMDAKIDQMEIGDDTTMSGVAKATAVARKSLISTLANVASAMKKIKADPTPATFNSLFNVSDPPTRKLQVQLIGAANGQKNGLLPTCKVDPRMVADKLTPWQAGGKDGTKAKDDEDKVAILKRLAEMSPVVKLAAAYIDDLSSKG